MDKVNPAVYRIINTVNDNCYVGSSVRVQVRKREHFFRLRRNTHANAHLQSAWNKYGEAAFRFEILEKTTQEVLIEREQSWIDALKPAYNIRKIAESNQGLKPSAKALEALANGRHVNRPTPRSEARKARSLEWQGLPEEERQRRIQENLANGRMKHLEEIASGEWQHSPEAIEAIKSARAKQETTPAMLEALKQGQEVRKQVNPKPRLGMKNSEETRRKQSEAAKQRPPISEATRAKQRAAKIGKKPSEESNRKRSATLKANPRVWTEEQRQRIAETNRATWAKKSAEEKHSYTQKRPSVSEETRLRQSEAAKNRKHRAS